jgi:hypothetical protein
MSFFDAISKFFGLDRAPETGKWPRKVGSHELPPERMPVLPPHLRPTLPFGIREVMGPEHSGWEPWQPRHLRDSDRNDAERMGDYLRDGCAPPPDKRR